jgi:hypothetical protein
MVTFSRRVAFGLPAVLAAACSKENDDMQQLPPWHLWGNTVVLKETIASAGDAQVSSSQLLKVSYNRPETWSFFAGASIVGGTPVGMVVRVSIDLILGVGRSMFDTKAAQPIPPGQVLQGFCVFAWNLAPGVEPTQTPNNVRFASVGRSVVRDANTDGPGSPALVQDVPWFTAQDIQAQATMSVAAAGSGNVQVEVSAFVAPRSHVRPDWFAPGGFGERFRGGETGGM